MEEMAKSISDKADVSYVMTKVSDRFWASLVPGLQVAIREGRADPLILTTLRPTHVLDIYKMRRGRYKNVRVWIQLNLGTGQRRDLFMTTADNQPITTTIDLFTSAIEKEIDWERK